MKWGSRFLLLMILATTTSCASPFYCTFKWTDHGRAEFKQLNRERGESAMIQDVKRMQQQCNASKAKYDLDLL